ncbi:MAG: hypothetical protein R3178_02265 [Rhodothermales bacterium]|nr:hypothetical protein [Rhodothermales bacterium]
MKGRILSSLWFLCLLTASVTFGQTSKYLPGDTLVVPPATQVDVIGGEGFVTADSTVAVLVGKRYPYWFIDFEPANGIVDSTKVGNSFFLGTGVVNRSLEARDLGLEHNRKLSRMGVDMENVGANVEQTMDDLAARGVPVLLKFSFEITADGGVEPKVRLYNISEERIRSVGIDFHGVDAQGEVVHCERSGKNRYAVRMNGPLDPDADCYFAFVNDPAFFNASTACLEIDSVTVEFMDGESIVMEEDLGEIQRLLKSPFMRRGECPS